MQPPGRLLKQKKSLANTHPSNYTLCYWANNNKEEQGVLTVTDIKYIRQEVNLKGRSYAEVARQMGHDVRTVKKSMRIKKTGANRSQNNNAEPESWAPCNRFSING